MVFQEELILRNHKSLTGRLSSTLIFLLGFDVQKSQGCCMCGLSLSFPNITIVKGNRYEKCSESERNTCSVKTKPEAGEKNNTIRIGKTPWMIGDSIFYKKKTFEFSLLLSLRVHS